MFKKTSIELWLFIILNVFNLYADNTRYSPYALSNGSFASFDKEYLGNQGYFNPKALAPAYIRENGENLKTIIHSKMNEGTPLWTSLFPGVDELKQKTEDLIESELKNNWKKFIGDAWGISVSNAENNPNGEDNLFIFIDNKYKNIVYLDFKHPMELSVFGINVSIINDILKLFGINLPNIKIPETGIVLLPEDPYTKKTDKFNDARGICTDRNGDFWIADKGNDRIVHLRYDPSNQEFNQIGQLKGLDSPTDVAFIPDLDKDSPALIAIANTKNNSIIMTHAYIEGYVDYSTIPIAEKKEILTFNDGGQSKSIKKPMCVGQNILNNRIVYIGYDYNKILKMDRQKGFEFNTQTTEWPEKGLITSIKSDINGDIFIIDNTNGFIGKYTQGLDLIFITGGFCDGDIRSLQRIGLNQPRYIAIGNSINNLYISEKVSEWSGIKRFINWPKFIDGAYSFHLNCNNENEMEFQYELTKKGYVRTVIEKVEEGKPDEVVFDNKNFMFNSIAGENNPANNSHLRLPFKKHDLAGNPIGNYLPTNAIYKVTFYAYDNVTISQNPGKFYDEYSDNRPFFINFSAPEFINAVSIAQNNCNPPNSYPIIEFNTNEDVDITFKLVKDDGTNPKEIVYESDEIFFPRQYQLNGNDYEDKKNKFLFNISGVPAYANGYYIYADLKAPDNLCGLSNNDVKISDTRIFIDNVPPNGNITNIRNSNSYVGNVNGFNPGNEGFENLLFDAEITKNNANAVNYQIDIVEYNHPENVVYNNLYSGTGEGRNDLIWNGKKNDNSYAGNGEYAIKMKLLDNALNKKEILSEKIIIDNIAPTADLILDDKLYSYYKVNKITNNSAPEYALVLNNTALNDVQFTITDNLCPYKITADAYIIDGNKSTAINRTSICEITNSDKQPWSGVFTIPANTFTVDGLYKIDISVWDKAGNKINGVPLSSSLHGNINYLIVNKKAPTFTLNVIKNIIKSNETNYLMINAAPTGYAESMLMDFKYEVNLTNNGSPVPGYLAKTGSITSKDQIEKIPFDHSLYSGTGKYTYQVDLWDNIGKNKGNIQTQTFDFYVDEFPTIIDGIDGEEVSNKFYVTGQVGDPDITNSSNEKGFEYYEVYYKKGIVSGIPADLSGWQSKGVFVPLQKIDRDKNHYSTFPYSNRADNEEAASAAWGKSVLAYIDGSSQGANLQTGEYYSILVFAKEKGQTDPPTLNSINAAVRYVQIANRSSTIISNVNIEGLNSNSIDFSQTGKELKISGKIQSNNSADITACIFSTEKDIDKDGHSEPIAISLEKKGILNNGEFQLLWDGKDAKGSYVKDGDYQIILLSNEKKVGNIGNNTFDLKDLSSGKFEVKTPLAFNEISISPTTISNKPQDNSIPPSNITTLQYRVSKPCDTYIDIYSYNNGTNNEAYLCTIGPEQNMDGAGVMHYLSWNCKDKDGNIVSVGIYHLKPYLKEINGTEKKYYTDKNGNTFFIINVGDVNGDTPEIGNFTMPSVVYGNSDAIWSTKINADLWSFPDATTNNDIRLYAEGKQSLYKAMQGNFSGGFIRQHTKINFKIRVKWAVNRQAEKKYRPKKGEEYGCCSGPRPWANITEDYYVTSLQKTGNETFTDFNLPAYECAIDPGNGRFDEPSPHQCVQDEDGNACLLARSSKMWKDPKVLWIRAYTLNGTLISELYNDREEAVQAATNPDLFKIKSIIGRRTDQWNARLEIGCTFYWDKLYDEGELPPILVTPGDPVQNNVVTWATNNIGYSGIKDFDGAIADITDPLVDPTGFKLSLRFKIPPGGIIRLPPGMGGVEFQNTGTATAYYPSVNTYYDFTQSNVSAGFDNKQIRFDYDIVPPPLGTPQDDAASPVAEICMPIPMQSHSNDCMYNGMSVWDPTQNWILTDVGDPTSFQRSMSTPPLRAIIANVDKDLHQLDSPPWLNDKFVFSIGKSTVGSGGLYQFINSSGDAALIQFPKNTNYTFESNSSSIPAKTGLGKDVILSATISNYPSVSNPYIFFDYPYTPANATPTAWSSITDDPVISGKGGYIKNYLHLGPNSSINNPANYNVTNGYTGISFKPEIILGDNGLAYQAMANDIGWPVPQTNAGKLDLSKWNYSCVVDNSDYLFNHFGMNFKSWDPVRFEYINGEENNNFDCTPIDNNGKFNIEIKGNACFKRIVPITINIEDDQYKDLIPENLYIYNTDQNNPHWEDISNLSYNVSFYTNGDKLDIGENTIGYWDVTGKAGLYYIRFKGNKSGNTYQLTGTIKIGTEVPETKPASNATQIGGFTVYSPLRRVQLWFPPESKYSGMAAIDPVNIQDLAGVEFGNIPKGFVVDVSPSGLMFDDNAKPQMTFYLTQKDINAINGDISNLGDIGIYYLNPKTNRLENAIYSASIYNLNDGSTDGNITRTLQPNEALQLTFNITHTSLYGALSKSSFITMEYPVSPTSENILNRLNGTASNQIFIDQNIHLYIAHDKEWTESNSQEITNLIHYKSSNNTWYVDNISLPYDGDNYIFASIGTADNNHIPSNSILIIKDRSKPDILNCEVDPVYAGSNTNTIQIKVKLSEPGEVYLSIPFISDQVLYSKAEEPGNTAVYSIPINDPNISDGEYSFIVTANDVVGNCADQTYQGEIHIDKTAPDINNIKEIITYDNTNGYYKIRTTGVAQDLSGISKIEIIVKDCDPSWKIEYLFHGENETPYDLTINTPGWQKYFSSGAFKTIIIRATDVAGNTGIYEKNIEMSKTIDVNEWPYSKEITINISNIFEDDNSRLNEFPILIKFDESTFDFSQALVDGSDLRFVKDGIYELPYEIEYWNPVSKKGAVWVKIPEINTQDENQSLTVYWGNINATSTEYAPIVWNKNFKVVYHMNKITEIPGVDNKADTAIFTLNSCDIRDRSQIYGTIGSNNYVEVGVESDVKIKGNLYSGGNTYLRSKARIEGDVKAGGTITEQQNVKVLGNIEEKSALQQFVLPIKSIQYGSSDITVLNDKERVLAPGKYRDIQVQDRGTLKLSSGVYDCRKLEVGIEAKIVLDVTSGTNIEINASENVRISDRTKMVFNGEAKPILVRIYSNQTNELFIGCGSSVYGIIKAPLSKVHVYTGVEFTGAIYAKEATIEPDNVFNAVYIPENHLKEIINDATLNNNDANNYGSEKTGGIVGDGRRFSGDDYIDAPSVINGINNNEMTFTAWIKRKDNSSQQCIAGMKGDTKEWNLGIDTNDKGYLSTDALTIISNSTQIPEDNWEYFAAVYNTEYLKFYLNGKLVDELKSQNPIPITDAHLIIGKWIENNYFDGTIDEIRVSDIARSDEWIRMEYLNQLNTEKTVLLKPIEPQGITVSLEAGNNVRIKWLENSPSIDKIAIERKISSESNWTKIDEVNINSMEYVDKALGCEKEYEYRFKYTNNNYESEYSNTFSISTFACDEDWPTNFTATTFNESAVRLRWKDNSNNETGYEIQKSLYGENANYINVVTTVPDVTTYVVDSLNCETEYKFRIRLVKNTWISDWIYAEKTATDFCDKRPFAPSNLTASLGTGNQIILNWKDNSSDEDYFIIYKKHINDDNYGFSGLVSKDVNKFIDNEVNCDDTITYVVASFNSIIGGGLSSFSDSINVITGKCTENEGNNLISLSDMIIDSNKNPVNKANAVIAVKLYSDQTSTTPIYSEIFDGEIKNGLIRVNVGTYNDIGHIINKSTTVYYEMEIDNTITTKRMPFTSKVNTICNPMVLNGRCSPVGSINANTGSLYLNTDTHTLYFKYGKSISDWKKVE